MIGDVDGVVMANCMKPVVIRSQSVVELNQISPMVHEPATYTSEALADRYLKGSNASSALIIQIVYILQLDSSVTGSLPTGSVVSNPN